MVNRISPEADDRTHERKKQKYSRLKRNCVKKNVLFDDPIFPPVWSSLCYSKPDPGDIQWKRPKDIVPEPKFFIDSASADDFAQGSLGNCWFVAACACIAKDSALWKKIIPDYKKQEWAPENDYAGIFHFRFWRCGRWEDVVIDDKLPIRSGQLIYTRSKTRNEFWSALLEKAFAKLYGSYEALNGGNARDALVDLTGGVAERLVIRDYKNEEESTKLFNILNKAMDHRSLMCSSIEADSSKREVELSVGLITGHEYSITSVRNIQLKGTGLFGLFNKEKIQMIRLRNPWGQGEWKGAWSDGSPEWQKVSNSKKKDLGLTFDDEGEFWMSFKDFCEYFTDVDICHMVNTSFFTMKKTWRDAYSMGQWENPSRAGGCRNNATFLENPQYLLSVSDDEDEVMISLEQEDRRSLGRQEERNFSIGVTVMKTDVNRKYRMHDRLDLVHSSQFVQARSNFTRFPLSKGCYLLIPSTFNPGQDGSFLLRIFTSGGVKLKELRYEQPEVSCIWKSFEAATAVHIFNAEKLGNGNEEMRAYCVVKCEGKKIQTTTSIKSQTPTWNDRITVYRKKPQEDIVVQMWKQNFFKDYLIGSVTLKMSEASSQPDVRRPCDLTKMGADKQEETTAVLYINLRHSTDMEEF